YVERPKDSAQALGQVVRSFGSPSERNLLGRCIGGLADDGGAAVVQELDGQIGNALPVIFELQATRRRAPANDRGLDPFALAEAGQFFPAPRGPRQPPSPPG